MILVADRALRIGRGTDDTVIVTGGLTILALIILHQGLTLRDAERFARGLSQRIDCDPLTGLSNHRKMLQRLDRELVQTRAHGRPVALAMIDVDDFKSINDRFGHQSGDEVLKSVADALTRACRETDLVARYAGDEFVLIVPGLDLPNASAVSQRIQSEIAHVQIDTSPTSSVPVSVSIGIAVTHASGISAGNLIAVADRAMYDAKRSGKNLTIVVDADRLVKLRRLHSDRRPSPLAQPNQIDLTG